MTVEDPAIDLVVVVALFLVVLGFVVNPTVVLDVVPALKVVFFVVVFRVVIPACFFVVTKPVFFLVVEELFPVSLTNFLVVEFTFVFAVEVLGSFLLVCRFLGVEVEKNVEFFIFVVDLV